MGAEDRGEAAAGVTACLFLAEPMIALMPVSSSREPLCGFCEAWAPCWPAGVTQEPGMAQAATPDAVDARGDP